MRRGLMIVGAVVLGATLIAPGGPADAKAAKTQICHVDDDGVVRAISVADRAVPAHRAHGDGLPGEPVPGQAGFEFGPDCQPVAVVIDSDGDGVLDPDDNCPSVPNPSQSDRYGSPKGDACEDDSNGDGVLDVDEESICVSIDGADVIAGRGGATCSTSEPDSGPSNIAVAHGSLSIALAFDTEGGGGNLALAGGAGAAATAWGTNNTAIADGDCTAFAMGDAQTDVCTGP